MLMSQDVVALTGLTRRFGTVVANDDIALRVRPGEVVGLLGHNGAGKTTLVSQIVGLLRPDAGTIRVGGIDEIGRASCRERGEVQGGAGGVAGRRQKGGGA